MKVIIQAMSESEILIRHEDGIEIRRISAPNAIGSALDYVSAEFDLEEIELQDMNGSIVKRWLTP